MIAAALASRAVSAGGGPVVAAPDGGRRPQWDHRDMYQGERWAHETVEAGLRSPAWPRTLLIYTYDEHGGCYDHVPPPSAITPDDIPPKLRTGESGDYSTQPPASPRTSQ